MTGYVQMHFDVAIRRLLFEWDWNQLPKIDCDEITKQGADENVSELSLDEILHPEFKVRYEDGNTDKNERVRFESVIDFPHFLLHVLRVYVHAKNVQFPEKEETQRLLDDKKLLREFERVLLHGQI